MKLTSKDMGIASGLAASALLAADCQQPEKVGFDSFVESSNVQSFTQPLILSAIGVDVENNDHSAVTISIPAEQEWNESAKSRFIELAGNFAIGGRLDVREEEEYEMLKDLRRTSRPSRSYEEIVADLELHRKVTEAINSLKSLVEYTTTTYPAETRENRS